MADKIDRFLTIASTPDWIRPLVGLIQDFRNGPRHRFYIDRQGGFSVNQLKRLLKKYQVKYWGDMIADDMIIITVRQNQARWAEHQLLRAGVPLLNRVDH